MGGMLIDQQQVFPALHHNISAERLPQHPKRRRFLWRLRHGYGAPCFLCGGRIHFLGNLRLWRERWGGL